VGGYFSISRGNGFLGINGGMKKSGPGVKKSETGTKKLFIAPFSLEDGGGTLGVPLF